MKHVWWKLSILMISVIIFSPNANPFVFSDSGKIMIDNHAQYIFEYKTNWYEKNNNFIQDTITSISDFQKVQKTFVESNNIPANYDKDGPMDSAWPMFSHDVAHTGRSPFSTDNNSGNEIWYVRSDKDGAVWGSAVIDNDGIIYFGTTGSDASIYALYPNGTQKWQFFASGALWVSPALAENGDIYCTTWGSIDYFQAITKNGTERWHFHQEGSSASAPTIGSDGTIYFGTDSHNIFAVNPSGAEKWRYTTGYIVMSSPSIGEDGTIYIGSCDHYLYALNPNGTLRWRFGTGNEIKGSASIAQDGTIYVPSFDGYLYALYPNGTMKWRTSTGSSVAAAGVALADDDTIYIGTEKLRAYNPDGTLKWITDLQGSIYGSIPAVSADGTIFVSAGGSLVAVNPDGTIKWRNHLSLVQIKSSPVIGPDDRVYVGSEAPGLTPPGYLHAIGKKDANAPTNPTISGEIEGKIHRKYEFTFTSTSPLTNNLFYQIDWGNGTLTDWLGPYSSGESITLSHSWSEKGTYTIRARAKDTENLWSSWGTLSVTMPFSYDLPILRFFDRLLERFPNAFPFLRQIMGY
ncbi:MAG TPA: PQQ-binding-like beta-propeller repeat protein [Candidatus Thermoplasmatota archaeon]|nr:PQQ-binding-like beta-propeller repeat protein [Candidatus Thermoplasmatota archaeon]